MHEWRAHTVGDGRDDTNRTRPGVNREPAAEAGGGCLGLAPLPPRHQRHTYPPMGAHVLWLIALTAPEGGTEAIRVRLRGRRGEYGDRGGCSSGFVATT